MITTDDIKNLAHLARIEVPEEEMGKLAGCKCAGAGREL